MAKFENEQESELWKRTLLLLLERGDNSRAAAIDADWVVRSYRERFVEAKQE